MLSQPRVTVSEVIPAPIEDVWATIRPFDAIGDWHPGITNCRIENGLGATEIGGVRAFEAGGRSLREQLVAHSDVERTYRYTILEGAGAKENYLSELRAIPITESDETLVVWQGDFDADPDERADADDGLLAVYTAGIENLRSSWA